MGSHGREWWSRLPARALVLSFAAVFASGRPLASQERHADLSPSVALHTRLLLAQRAEMLDVAVVGDRLLVLEPGQVTLRPRADGAADAPPPLASAAISTTRIWPRDLRGRLNATPASFEALLPGVVCRGRLTPLTIACADEGEAWPLGIDNGGIIAGRNYFTTPEGLALYGAAPLGGTAARWLVADQRGTLTFLDGSRAVIGRADAADDVVRLEERCAPGDYVVAVSTTDRDTDALVLFRVSADKLSAVSRLVLPGSVTALWIAAGERFATAIVRHPGASRYDAFHVGLSCAR